MPDNTPHKHLAMVAKKGFETMKGEGHVVTGWHDKLHTAIASITPAPLLAEAQRMLAEPGTTG